jgi:antitoxin component YwqK of YwqJK toxin-antitoxin module/CHAT domain-containing protein/tetratricopeptide (TPR) repeat protein
MKFGCFILFVLSFATANAQFPISPNAFDAQGKRNGHWTVLYDSNWNETLNKDSAFHYRLVRFEAGKPVGKVRDFFRSGVKQWDGYLLSVNPDVQDGEQNYYFENGRLHYHYLAANGKKNGIYQEFAISGTMISQGYFKADSADGKWIWYTTEGIKDSESEWKDNKPNGPVTIFFPSGKIRKKGFKVMNNTEGKWEEFYEDGQLKSREYFKNGNYDGPAETYYENGVLESKGSYKQDLKTGSWNYYHENGKLKVTGRYDEEGKQTGLWKSFYDNGNLKLAAFRRAGQLHGTYEEYFENGQLKIKSTCEEDLWQGLMEEYYENDQLAKKGNYLRDSLDGHWVYYHDNGKLKSEGNLVDNKKNGTWRYYDSLGHIETEETLVMGQLQGRLTNYHTNGQVSEFKEYVKGKETGLYQSFYENGLKKAIGKKTEGQREGEWIFYHQNGQQESKENYKNGLWDGPYLSYYPNGVKKSEGTAHNDMKEGYRKFYYQHGKLKSEGNMHLDKRQGHWIFYDSITGAKESEGEYVNDKLNGKWNYYLLKNPIAYYINGFEETFYNIKDSLKILLDKGDVPHAHQALVWMDRVRKRDYKKEKYEATMMLYWKGFLANIEKKLPLALQYDQRFLKEIKKLKGDTSVEYRNGSNNLALTLSEMGRIDESLKILKDLSDIYIQQKVEEDGDIRSYGNVASVYNTNHQYKEEVEYLEKILAQRKASGKTNAHYTFDLLVILADVYNNDLKNTEKARALYNAIIHLGDSLSATQDYNYGYALYRLGLMHRNEYNNPLAAQYFKKACSNLRNHLRKAPNYYLSALTVLGYNYLHFNQPDSAQAVYDEMEKAIQQIGWQKTAWQAKWLKGNAEIHLNKFENREAIALWLQAKELLESLSKTESMDYAEVLQALAAILPSVDYSKANNAESYLLQAIDIVYRLEGNSSKYRVYLTALARLYNDIGRYDKANEVLQKAKQYISEAEGESPKLAECENLLAENEYDLSHYTEAIRHSETALKIMEPRKKEDPLIYTDALSWLSTFYNQLNEMDKAERYIREALKATKELLGEESPIVINHLQDLAKLQRNQNLYSDAEKTYKEAAALARKKLGEENSKFAYLLNAQANMHRENNNFKKALQEYLRYKPLIEKLAGTESSEYVMLLTNLGFTYEGLENRTEAEKYHLQALRTARKILGNKNSECAWKLKNLADFYSYESNFQAAENYLEEAVQIQREVYGETNTEYANFLKYLAKAKTNLDKFKDAETLLLKAVSINKKNMIDRFGSYIGSMEDLQQFYQSFGRHQDALDQLNTILPMISAKWGEKYRYAINLAHKATAFIGLENYDSAKIVLLQSLAIQEEELASTHWAVLEAHNLLGVIELKQMNAGEAEKHFRFCIEQRKISGQDSYGSQATSLSNLAAALLIKKENSGVEKIIAESNQILVKLNDTQGIDYNHLHLGKLYLATNQLSLAEIQFRQAMENRKADILSKFYFLSDHEKAQFWKANRFFIDYFQSFAVQRMKSNPAILTDLYNLQLNTKGVLLSTSNKIKKRILTSRDSSMISRYYQWLKQRDQLAQFYVMSKEEQKTKKATLDSLESATKANEKELNITADDLEKDKGKEATWREVQRALSPQEAAVEIVRIRHHSTYATDSILYVALVLTSEMKNWPQATIMADGKLLEGRGLRFYKNAILSQLEDTSSYSIYWKNIEALLRSKSKVYLSMDGVYNSINLNTLRTADGKFLADTKQITIVSNTRDIPLLKKKTNSFNQSTASLIGFPKYFLGKEKLKQKASKERDLDLSRVSEEDQSGIAELPGTKTEIEKVDDILQQHHWRVTTYTNEEASEEAIKEIHQPALLHIATHGFFVDEKNNSSWMSVSDPMLRAGLLFTGAANFLQDKFAVADENGILTAYEAANLNLDNTELVILSACETGQGEVQNGEGVYGLQRAFQTAGAKSILMSLWKVDDTATQELMTLFYQNWTSGKSKTVAFKQAQLSLKEKYPQPYYWGAFVMMGE